MRSALHSTRCPVCGAAVKAYTENRYSLMRKSYLRKLQSYFFSQATCPSCAIVFRISKIGSRLSLFTPSSLSVPAPGKLSQGGVLNNTEERTRVELDSVHSTSNAPTLSPPRSTLGTTTSSEPAFRLEINNFFLGLHLNFEVKAHHILPQLYRRFRELGPALIEAITWLAAVQDSAVNKWRKISQTLESSIAKNTEAKEILQQVEKIRSEATATPDGTISFEQVNCRKQKSDRLDSKDANSLANDYQH